MQHLKELILRAKGSDPVILKIDNDGKPISMVASSHFWVEASEELAGIIKGSIGNKFCAKCEVISAK